VRVFLIIFIFALSACSSFQPITVENGKAANKVEVNKGLFCAQEWLQYVESQINTSDNRGHGPDLGSIEWQSVVEFKLGLIQAPALPSKSSAQWCEYIQEELNERHKMPMLSCQGARPTSIERLICSQPSIVMLDEKLSMIFKSVLAKSDAGKRDDIKAEQRVWFESRDECLIHEDKLSCIRDAYQFRIAELQANYDLVEGLGPIYYVCDGQLTDEVAVRFYPTEPPSLLAESGNQLAFMVQVISASGSKYQGHHTIFWEHQGKAYITWGAGSSLLDCKKMH
jgi:uncharacterized protein